MALIERVSQLLLASDEGGAQVQTEAQVRKMLGVAVTRFSSRNCTLGAF
jgi:hypothetical protein